MSKEKLLASAQKNLEKGQIGKAIKDYQKILEADPKDIRNRQKLAELLSRERMKDEALKEYETVARTYSDTGFYLKAIAVYRQMQRLDPGRPDIYLRLAELNEKQGLTGDALAEYRNLNACYEKNRMFSEQLKALQKMRELEPENLTTRVKIVENNLLVDSAEVARKELQALLDELAAAGDSARALKLYEHFLPRFPDDLLLRAGQAEALVRSGDKARGMEILHDLQRKEPENADLLSVLARVYGRDENHREERRIYERLLARQPDDLEWRAAYLRAGIAVGETAAARQDLEKWQADFVAAGRNELVQELQSRLGGVASMPAAAIRPEVADDDSTLEAPEEMAPAAAVAGAPEPQDAEIVEDLEEIAELIEEEIAEVAETAPASDDPEEVSLDFLEEAPLDFLETTVPPAEPERSQPELPVPTEVELELELDMELELDIDMEDGLTIAAPAEEAEILLELELADEVPAETASSFDLGAAIADELDDLPPPASAPAAPGRPQKRIKTDVEVDDPESHYNLGIAYKEMGLLDDAIGEFDKAMAAPGRGASSLILKSMCLLEKGEHQQAEATLRAGLKRTDVDEEGRIGLHYELGEIYEGDARLQEALECFQFVADRDLFYRNAGDRVAALRQRLGLNDGAAGAGGRKNRVSYV